MFKVNIYDVHGSLLSTHITKNTVTSPAVAAFLAGIYFERGPLNEKIIFPEDIGRIEVYAEVTKWTPVHFTTEGP